MTISASVKNTGVKRGRGTNIKTIPNVNNIVAINMRNKVFMAPQFFTVYIVVTVISGIILKPQKMIFLPHISDEIF